MTTACSTYYNNHGQPDKIYNEEGYIALHGDSVSYHFFERDYLGSVRAVFDLYGNLEQTNDYNVTGIPSSRHLGNADVPGKIIPIKIGYNIQHSIDGFLKLDLPE